MVHKCCDFISLDGRLRDLERLSFDTGNHEYQENVLGILSQTYLEKLLKFISTLSREFYRSYIIEILRPNTFLQLLHFALSITRFLRFRRFFL